MSESLVFVMSSPKHSPVYLLLWLNAQVWAGFSVQAEIRFSFPSRFLKNIMCLCTLSVKVQKWKWRGWEAEEGPGALGARPGLAAAPAGTWDSHVTPMPPFPVYETRGLDQIISGSDVCTTVVLTLLDLLLLFNKHTSKQLPRPLFPHTRMNNLEKNMHYWRGMWSY